MSFSLKTSCRRFKAWQVHPADVQPGDEPHRCNNCGLEFTGRFCPDCGQRATAGRITWQVVRKSFMDVWGLGGRSLPYSLWQLLWRPGYFISDYINGKWQSSFPPVKMLVLVALALYIVGKAIFPEYWDVILEIEEDSITSTGWQYYYDYVSQWIGNHLEWMFLFIFSFLIIPTWFLYRYSPRNSRHTLPQGFFIQVFMTTQYIMWLFIISLCIKLASMNMGYEAGSSRFVDLVNVCSILLLPFIVLINYKQLFGYNWWGTVWRETVLIITSVTTCVAFLTLIETVKRSKLFLLALFCILSVALLLSLTDVVNRRLWRERGLLRAMVVPLLFFLSLIGIGAFLEMIKPGILLGFLGAIINA